MIPYELTNLSNLTILYVSSNILYDNIHKFRHNMQVEYDRNLDIRKNGNIYPSPRTFKTARTSPSSTCGDSDGR